MSEIRRLYEKIEDNIELCSDSRPKLLPKIASLKAYYFLVKKISLLFDKAIKP